MPELDAKTQTFFDSIAPRLTSSLAVPILEEYLEQARSPRGVLATVQATAEGMTGKAFGWHRVTVALLEMAAAGRPFAPIILRAFAEKVSDIDHTELDRAKAAEKWVELIDSIKMELVTTGYEARQSFDVVKPAFTDEALAWRQLSLIQPTSMAYRNATTPERVQHVRSRITAGTEVFTG